MATQGLKPIAIKSSQILSQSMKGRMIKLIADCGLPLKITATWDETDYPTEKGYSNVVAGWLIRINGRKYPRDAEGDHDYSYRYTPRDGRTDMGRWRAIDLALRDAGLTVSTPQQKLMPGQKMPFNWMEQQMMMEGFRD